MKLSILLFVLISLSSSISFARIQYAAKHRINRCTVCHLSPVGGSLRNKNGKAYGQHGFASNPFSKQDMFSADVRMIFYKPENSDDNKGGLGVMNGQLGINVPVMEKGTFPYETRLVYAQNIGGFGGTSPRNAFVRWKFNEDTETSFLPQYALLGRFHAPFGVLTDEHRTYVRLQNNTTWNNFEMGALFAANPFESLHYDIALVNGEKTSGSSFGSGRANDWGAIANLRFAPAWAPFVLGTSYSHYSAATDASNINNSNPKSTALYSVIPLQRVSRWLPLTLSLELQESNNWNEDSGFISYMSPTSPYKDSVVDKKSLGRLFRADIHLNQKLDFIYQYDSLLLNSDFPRDSLALNGEFSGDTYIRQGFGLRWAMGPGMLLNIRHEEANGGSNTETVADTRAKQKAFWMVLQIAI